MSRTTTREEHLAWCKQSALEYDAAGDLTQAFISTASDLDIIPRQEIMRARDLARGRRQLHERQLLLGGRSL